MVRGERDRALAVRRDAVLVHEAHEAHGEALRRRDEPVGKRERGLADGGGRGRRGPEALELSLRQRAEHHHTVGVPGRDGRRGVADGRRSAPTAAAPLHVREAQLRETEGGGEPGRVITVVAVRGESVHLARRDARVLAGGEDGAQRQLHLRLGGLPVLVVRGLADAGDGDTAADRLGSGHVVLIQELRSGFGTRHYSRGRRACHAPCRGWKRAALTGRNGDGPGGQASGAVGATSCRTVRSAGGGRSSPARRAR
jgi:hypothetical protein